LTLSLSFVHQLVLLMVPVVMLLMVLLTVLPAAPAHLPVVAGRSNSQGHSSIIPCTLSFLGFCLLPPAGPSFGHFDLTLNPF